MNNEHVLNERNNGTGSIKKSKERRNNTIQSVCMFAFVLSSLVNNTFAKAFEMTNFNNKTNVGFKSCGTGALISGEWHLITHMDWQEYDSSLLTSRNNAMFLNSDCQLNQTSESKLCQDEMDNKQHMTRCYGQKEPHEIRER